jgi:hypothetical protein
MGTMDDQPPAPAVVRVPFTDLAHRAGCVLVIPPGGRVYPAGPGALQIGVEHPGCTRVADLALDLDAFFCPSCQRNGRISGRWASGMIAAACR